jgi:uncharacterized membrane-anchored protein YhcB (DUF1043 family)
MDALHGPWPKQSGHALRLRWQMLVGSIFAAVILGVLGYVAFANHARGQQWQERAELARIDVQRLTQERETLEADLTTVKRALKSSEKDVKKLERRLSQVSDEKAQVEDERENATAYAERLREVAIAYDDAGTLFQICRDENDRWLEMMGDFDYYYHTGQTYLIDDQARTTAEACARADSYLTDLRSDVDALFS